MKEKIQKFFEGLIPFLVLGVAIALLLGLLLMFSYLLMWGLVIGTILWAIITIKSYLFPSNKQSSLNSKGRIIEHQDKK